MKYEWRRQEKTIYTTKRQPQLLTIPAQTFITLHGTGNPNGSEFQAQLQTLYPAAYGLKHAYKQYAQAQVCEFDDYVVFPLEGVWSLTTKGQQLDHLDKNEFSYDIMIRVPDFVPTELIAPALAAVKARKQVPTEQIEVQQFAAMQVAQILHIGAYDDEPASFAKMDQLVASQAMRRTSKIHREIYLSDARRVAPNKLKTILRYRVTPN
ncbi:GyrI-like domain-containing protein [Lactiplantibacillus sp. DA1]|uniref:GyrI-like domain-containing protein n=1 Tax=Lactiplantibacillus sp. DA1 TaxID=3079857 RepID=UPI00292A62ED|nr:GyrI-like domain-containing protein [Lactiplantibacillus sp. DA1]MDV0430442.1 GyrI-like domain-containing protein [Lactiplantibacillus sp. DA1]